MDTRELRTYTALAARLAGSMNPDQQATVATVLLAINRMAKNGVKVDSDAVRAVTDAALGRLSGSMHPHRVADTLAALGGFAKSGVALDAAAVRAFSDAAILVSVDMNHFAVHRTLSVFVNLAESGLVAPLDPRSLQALRDAAARVADDTHDERRTHTLSALAKLAGMSPLR